MGACGAGAWKGPGRWHGERIAQMYGRVKGAPDLRFVVTEGGNAPQNCSLPKGETMLSDPPCDLP